MKLLLYSIKSHRKIVHLTNCKVIQRIPKQNRRTFDSLEKAFENGYHLCNCCPAIAHRYHKEKKAIDSFCRDNQLQLKLKDGAIHVSSVNDYWQIITNGNSRKLFLYHKNKYKKKHEEIPSLIPGYHSQAYHSDTITGYLKYITEHDAYRAEHPYIESKQIEKISYSIYSASVDIDKYGESGNSKGRKGSYKIIKGTKRYRKEQKRKKRQERWASIARVKALIEELAARKE